MQKPKKNLKIQFRKFYKLKKDYIKNKFNSWTSPIRSLHNRILAMDVLDIEEPEIITPYHVLQDWLLEILQYGVLITIITGTLFYQIRLIRGIQLIIGFGILRWLLLDLLKDIKQRIK